MPSRRERANAIRALSMDAVQRASSGHPGAPMGLADIAEVLYSDYLRHNPNNARWPDRDRVLMSNGHGSMLLYALLHLTGYPGMPLEQIRQFRQLGSVTPGHPESDLTEGIETTTGPLGQGLANGVGMAVAERALAARFNRDDLTVVDHYTYVFAGDGCLMEGISHEAGSLAGTLGLGKLIVFYDDNGISIDGDVSGWFTDDTPKRFEAYGWHVVPDVDGHDPEAVRSAIDSARAADERPSLICCKTVIGWGAPNKHGTADVHGAALGEDEVAAAREALGWRHPPFEIPEEIYADWDARETGARLEADWRERLDAYRERYPELAAELDRRLAGELPEGWAARCRETIEALAASGGELATRKASQKVLDSLGPLLPELIGGSADLSGSNNTKWSGAEPITRDTPGANYIYFGVREFAMTAMLNGIALHGGFVPYGGTFLVFSDYARNAIRLGALMRAPTVLVYTHDSIGLGEDGPTHQPVEHLASLRLIPNFELWRPCDGVETAVAWQRAIERDDGPVALSLTRQGVPAQSRDPGQIEAIRRGGYVLLEPDTGVEAIIIATGSEVAPAIGAARDLGAEGRGVRVVSMPSTSVFDAQDPAYREEVLPAAVTARVAVEAGVSEYWYRYVGPRGRVIGLDRFGESAPAGVLMEHFGFTVGAVAQAVRELL